MDETILCCQGTLPMVSTLNKSRNLGTHAPWSTEFSSLIVFDAMTRLTHLNRPEPEVNRFPLFTSVIFDIKIFDQDGLSCSHYMDNVIDTNFTHLNYVLRFPTYLRLDK
jgi:hypothetical protein